MRRSGARLIMAAAASSLVFGSATAQAASAPPSTAQQAAPSPWVALSMLDASGAAGLSAGSQPLPPGAVPPADGPPPPPPPPPPPYGAMAFQSDFVPAPIIGFWLATIAAMVYIGSEHSSGHFYIRVPNSPA